MKFCDLLNEYISELKCSAKELSEKSGLSASVISRYRAGERIPFSDSEQLVRLSEGMFLVAQEKNIASHSKEEYLSTLSATLIQYKIDFDKFIIKFNSLIEALGINLTELAKSMNFDVSFISKIRTGQRKPANIEKFVDNICSYISYHYTSQEHLTILSEIISCSKVHLSAELCFNTLKQWLTSVLDANSESLLEMLCNYDEFDTEQYVKNFNYGDFEKPSFPDELFSKNYYGKQNMWRAFYNFFQIVLSSDNEEALYISADFPFNKIADETMGSGTFLSLLLSCINKGIKVYILHDLNKPERIVSANLKAWIPLYMTGMIYPYFLKTPTSDVYRNVMCVSSSAALRGECIGNDLDNGKIYLTNYPEEIDYYKRVTDAILRKAYPLIEIYGYQQRHLFCAILESDSMTSGNRRNILPSLPLYTMPYSLLRKILIKNNIPKEDIEHLLISAKKHRTISARIVENNPVTDLIYVPTKEEFEKEPPAISLFNIFYQKQVYYTYEEFMEHLAATKEYEADNPNYKISYRTKTVFRNITISIHDDKWVIISKNNSPIVHFIIRHSGLRKIICNYFPESTEK